MQHSELISKLKHQIATSLAPLINNDYVYLDIPYHSNIGDTLIWQGTEDFLSSLPYKCLYRCSWQTYQPQNIDDKVVILLHGGGNFGDIYPLLQQFRNRIIQSYPNNRIIILPQTVYYYGSRMLVNDSNIMCRHKDLYICARDKYSYEFLKLYKFSKHIILVPDMAFYIDITKHCDSFLPQTERVLLIKRTDKEQSAISNIEIDVPEDLVDIKDWIGFQQNTEPFLRLNSFIQEKKYTQADNYAINGYLPGRILDGIMMICPYKRVYSNRLHGSILSILLGKEVTVIDNSYGKNAHYYDTWLNDVPSIHIHRIKHVPNLKRAICHMTMWFFSIAKRCVQISD